MNQEPSTSAENPETQGEKKEEDQDLRLVDPFVDFECDICHMKEKSLFGDLKGSDGFYPAPVFFMRDPFAPPVRVKTRKPMLADFMVIGSTCSLCDRVICFDKACSTFFGSYFCASCIVRERRRFPDKVLEMLSKAQASIQKEEKKEVK
ncbi:unnamed protein product [Caenorhabditis auriculariae]|uniref:Cysteine-rich DPF motif domain-containing protein 1 n=1 Tax=Caenorhabditis auriculariae TaxID=2777116 RepID=A0A8S1HT33_9PELO|nr:unnamed protein product [Caenorhabditis auriculariae]